MNLFPRAEVVNNIMAQRNDGYGHLDAINKWELS